MAHHKSAIKHIKTSEARRQRNRLWKTRLRNATKKLATAPEGEKTERASTVVSVLHRSTARRVLHRNKAARLQARVDRTRSGKR
jgi:small subunit ribosomal protein S20